MSILFILVEVLIYWRCDDWTKQEVFFYSLLNLIACWVLASLAECHEGGK